ncbi:hydroxypyruvate isomerase family protein [Pseudohoeflea coraliihabitans]|uniref:TIM barrel protein n=1 Tax=Pseudohoeflea coraliihabitans TaxID=2860393 RepID=A0ABS6WNA4_9HYPH|nr:TIM barrel protein [Pseudohoeflea sp. DP4N28-3]MBW3096554.1 TIM barrel protein [Pseudohoeflea sp. DP4N28-3]
MKFSANLGFLFTELELPEAVGRAAACGFPAVEAHWPYATPAAQLKKALEAAQIPMLSLNTPRGSVAQGEFGLFAVPGREAEALAGFDQALDYAVAIGCGMIHAMAGRAERDGAAGQKAADCFIANLSEACRRAAAYGVTVLIEPINDGDAPGYFLRRPEQAAALMERIAADNLGLLFDCYHVQIEGGNVLARYRRHHALIRHVQFAAVPGRGAPDQGEIAYGWLLRQLRDAGHAGFFGAEYRPAGATEDSLAWLRDWR